MRRGHRLEALRQVAAIREVQAFAAEAEVARAAAERRDLDLRRRDCVDGLANDQARWSTAMSEPQLNLPLAGVWASAINARGADLDLLDRRIGEATLEADRLAQDWRMARERVDIVRDRVRSAVKAVKRAEDEAALNDIADQFARQGVRQ